MTKYIEVEVGDDFDDDKDCVFDDIQSSSYSSAVSRHDLEQALIDLHNECQFDITGTEATEEFADLKRRCRSLVDQLLLARREEN